jgi:hypothetical protein
MPIDWDTPTTRVYGLEMRQFFGDLYYDKLLGGRTVQFFSRKERKQLIKVFGEARTHTAPPNDLNAFTFLKHWAEDHPPSMSFPAAGSADDFFAWQEPARKKLQELMGHPFPAVDLAPEVVHETTVRGITIKKVKYHTQPHMTAIAMLAFPADSATGAPRPAMVCLPGHGAGKVGSIGFGFTPNHESYGIDLAARGFVTITLDQFGFGERVPRANNWMPGPEGVYMRIPQMLGLSAIGLRAWDVVRSIDFLETLPFVDKDHVGCVGNSGGGMTTTFASAVDERIRAAVISGYFCMWWYSIMSIAHCPCNYIAHLMEYFTVADIVAMRAPQPTFVVSGEFDRIFPQAGVQEAYKITQQAYALAGAPDNLGIHVMPKTYHRFSGEKSYPWLEAQLKSNASSADRE